MPLFDLTNAAVQAAVIRSAVDIAKSVFKPEAVSAQKIASIAKDLAEHLEKADEPK